MRKALSIASLFALTLVVACGGGYPVHGPAALPTIAPGSGGASTAYASFVVIVPGATQTASVKRKPKFTAPPGSQSVTITLESVNGAPYTGTSASTTVALSSANSACESVSGQLSCSITVAVPVGVLEFQIDTFASTDGSGSPTGEGLVSVTTTAGQTTSVSATLGGTIAKIVLSLNGTAELGATADLSVIVNATDANGATIIGAYDTPITLSDTDSSGQTSLSSTTALTSSTAAAAVTLNYIGGAMSAPAVIGATESNIPASSITGTTFSPDTTVPTVNGASTTFTDNETYVYSYGPTGTDTYTNTVAVSTGQSFNGQSNLIAVSGLNQPVGNSPDLCCGDYTTYFAYTPQGATTSLGYVGFNAGGGDSTSAETCAAPYSNQLELPFPSSWSVLTGSGACTYTYSYNNPGEGVSNETSVFQADGSYSDIGTYNYSGCCAGDVGYYNFASQSDGSANIVSDCLDGPSAIISIPAPSTSTETSIALQTWPTGPIPSPGSTVTPAPATTTVPNIWMAIASASTPGPSSLAGGVPTLPLETDQFTVQPVPAALPSACPVSASILGTQPTLSQANESIAIADAMGDWHAFYTSINIQHFYLDGVGEICNLTTTNTWFPDDGGVAYYDGNDQTIDSENVVTSSYVTTTSLTATYSRVRNFTQALPATTRAFTAATYALIRSRVNSKPQGHRGLTAAAARFARRPATH